MFRKLRLLLFLLTVSGYITYAQPVAHISATPDKGCPGMAVSFFDASTGNPTSWAWTFPGGTPNSSTQQNPAILYNTPGTYQATLVSRNASGSSNVDAVTITVYPAPIADFTQDKTTGCYPTYVQFTNASTPGPGATIVSYAWTFGDGTQDVVASPNHRYNLAGSFPVTLYVKNNFGCQGTATIKNVQKAIVLTGGIIPNFSSSLNSNCTFPVTATFTNSTTGPAVLSYVWNFDDGSPVDNTLSPSHQYNVAKNYNVKLAVSSTQGCSDTISVPVNITASGNITDFTMPDTVCVNATVNFTNTSSPFPNSSNWDFDGNGSIDMTARNGTYVYTAPGTYNVTLNNTFAGCGGSQTKPIVVVNPPTTNFTGTNIISCKPPLTSTFVNNTTGASSWVWDFGDGSPKYNGQTPPPHTFNSLGTFAVNLMSSSAAGCSTNQTVMVNIAKPAIGLNGVPAYGCAPFTFSPGANTAAIDGIASYSWILGNGNVSSAQYPPPQTYAAGTYKIFCTITTNGGCQVTDSGIVKVGSAKPTAAFSFVPPSACIKSSVAFTDASTGGADQWLWQFGDGSTDTRQNPTYSYPSPGTYKVKLTAYNSGCWDTLSKTIVVTPPLANFKYVSTCGQKNSFTFTDISTGPTSWVWDFGDGSPKFNGQTPPVHVFPAGAPTTYNVSLEVANGACTDKKTYQVTANKATTINFSANPVCANTPFFVTAVPAGPVYSYEFLFDDGHTILGTSATVSYNYTKPGTYNIRVVTYDNVTNCYDTSGIFPFVVNGPTANFSGPPALSCSALTVNFQDLSTKYPATSNIVKWAWDFGDGGTSTSQNPVYTYSIQGNFVPRLTVTDNNGCTSTLDTAKPVTISIIDSKFSVADTNSCPGAPSPVKFNNGSTGGFNPVYSWDFGDGNTSSLVSPTHAYNGVQKYIAILTVSDFYGCSVPSKSIIINVDTPHASFTMSGNFSACPVFNDTFTFTGHYAKTYAWDFKDGGISQLKNPVNGYALPGDYWPYLTVVSPGGCISISDSQHVHIDGPIGTLSYTPLAGCDSLLVNFTVTTTNVVAYTWFFGDGTDSLRTSTPTQPHKYLIPGGFTPIVYLTDALGCRLAKIGQQMINVDAIFKPYFTADKIVVCDSGNVKFADSSTLGDKTVINNYVWDFGDGSPQISGMYPNTQHYYSLLGNDSVSMSMTSVGGCAATIKKAVFIVGSPKVSIGGLIAQCEPAVLNFTGNELVPDPNGPLNWSWDFGNGKTATGQNPASVFYPKAGDYIIQLVATNTKGCKTMPDTTAPNNHLRIYPIPNVNAGPDTTICVDIATGIASVVLNATGSPSTTFDWEPAIAPSTLSCNPCSNPTASSPSTATFIVRGTSPQTCYAKDTVVVTVNVPPVVNISGPDSVCLGQSIPLTASGAAIYSWTPSQGLDNPNISNPMAKPDASQVGSGNSTIINYQVTGYDSKRCFSDTKSVDITAFNYPVISMPPNATINVGNSYAINSSASTNIVTLNWTPSNNLSCNNCLTPVATPTKSTTYQLTAVNDGGCASTDSFRLQVICNGANFFVPNTFSPNGDGTNDYFIVNGKGLNVIPSITIYNRWGQIVFQKSNFAPNSSSDAWDGRFNGQPAPPDVYIYTIQILCDNATLIPYHGNVTLIR